MQFDQAGREAIGNYPTPEVWRDASSSRGYCGKVVQDFSGTAEPVIEHTGNDVVFEGTSKQERSFEDLRTTRTTARVSQHLEFKRNFAVTNDASGGGIGAILSRGVIGKDSPIEYASQFWGETGDNHVIAEKKAFELAATMV